VNDVDGTIGGVCGIQSVYPRDMSERSWERLWRQEKQAWAFFRISAAWIPDKFASQIFRNDSFFGAYDNFL